MFDEAFIARLVAKKSEKFDREMKTGLQPVPGTADFIRRAAPHHRLAIASGALRHEIEQLLEWQGLRELFPVIVGAEDVKNGKPSPEPFLKALELTNELMGPLPLSPSPEEGGGIASPLGHEIPITPAECLVIEDSPLGIRGAIEAGMHTLGLTTSYPADRLGAAETIRETLLGFELDQVFRAD